MQGLRTFFLALICATLPMMAVAQDRLVRIYAPDALIESGLLKHILPRFSLKTQVRTQMVPPDQADLSFGPTGRAAFEGLGETWHLKLTPDHRPAQRLAEWILSDVGQRTVTGFAPQGAALFTPPQLRTVAAQPAAPDQDAVIGRALSETKCGRCHRVGRGGVAGIGSTPSFAVLRSLPDWEDRFSTFYVLNPHQSFTIIEEVTDPFPIDRPATIHPVTMTLEDLTAIMAFVTAMGAADLGAPLQSK
ncbi:MAG: cytochrome c [Pelagimonas sp.]|jgi:hypothetical protein|nr:cytochrome c [Pelagimonas sp.]